MLTAPLSLAGLDIAYPGRPSGQPVTLPGVQGSDTAFPGQPSTFMPAASPAPYNPGIGFFEGAIGNAESVTGQINSPGTPGGPTGEAGAPSAPGAGSGVSGGHGNSGGLLGDLGTIASATPAAQLGAQFGIPSTVANGLVGTIANAAVPGLGLAASLANFGLGAFGPAPPASQATVSGLQGVVNGLEGFLSGTTSPTTTSTPNSSGIAVGALGTGPLSESGIPSPTFGDLSNPSFTAAPTTAVTGLQGQPGLFSSGVRGGMPDTTTTAPVTFSEDTGMGPTGTGPAPSGDETDGGGTSSGTGTAGPSGSGDESDGGAAGGGGGGAGGATVICTELYRQGYLDEATWKADEAFGRTVDPVVLAGYYRWAPTVVRAMRRSSVVTRLVWVVAEPWTREMAHGDSVVGKGLMRVGMAVCRRLGQLKHQPA